MQSEVIYFRDKQLWDFVYFYAIDESDQVWIWNASGRHWLCSVYNPDKIRKTFEPIDRLELLIKENISALEE